MLDLVELGWDDSWRELASAYPHPGEVGRVIRVDKTLCTVVTASGPVRASYGGALLDAVAIDVRSAPCTGDWCVVRHWPDGPTTVEVVLERRTAVVRAASSGTSAGQVLVANVDVLAVVVALHPEPNLSRIERLVTLAWESGGRPVVVLTKADLAGDAEMLAEDVRVAAPSVDVIVCSTVTGDGIEDVRALVDGNLTLGLLGASGHGKSSLTNALVGAEVLTTKEIRDDGKGRHTTVRRELVALPGGGAVIDTPGLRGVGLQEAAEGLASTFPDIEALVEQCRFNDCSHQGEPGCSVQAAIADGTLAERRLDSWQRLRREMVWMASRTDARLRKEQLKKWKAVTKQNRQSRR
ncbi:MAG: ribosome small subunit-dependent GTPase A [Nocardioidaceae bacterium]|nr:ribosome small subunit-dependent GTPase A [Nocardioidaceae bacterium]